MAKAISSKKIKKNIQPAAAAATKKTPPQASPVTEKYFIEKLQAIASPKEAAKTQRYFKSGEGQYGGGDIFIGVRMGQLFALAAAFHDMLVAELEKLLENPIHEIRAGAVSIMDKAARNKKTNRKPQKRIL